MKITLSEEVGDFEKIRENFKKIMKFLISGDSNVIRLQSESIDFSALGVNSTIRTWTVFMQSDTGDCNITITSPRRFAASGINQNNTLWIFKGVSGAGIKTVSVSGSGDTIEGASSIEIANDQTIAIQSNGEEYKVLFDTTGGGGGGGRFGIEDILGVQDRTVDMQNFNLNVLNSASNVLAAGDSSYVGEESEMGVYPDGSYLYYQSDSTHNSTVDANAGQARIQSAAGDDHSSVTVYDTTGAIIESTHDITLTAVNLATAAVTTLTITPTKASIVLNGASSLDIPLINPASDFANDAAAATGGILVGQCYHTSGTVKIRLT